jgi:cell division protein WhiA
VSFSSEVKNELAAIRDLQCCAVAELSALLHIGGSVELSSKGLALSFQTSNNAVIRKLMKLIKDRYRIDLTLIQKKQLNLNKQDLFVVRIEDQVETMMSELSLVNKTTLFFQDLDERIVRKECCKKAYLRGAFLAGGSVNTPDTARYHLEIQTFSQKQAEILQVIASEFELNAKVAKNKRGWILYLKEAERISDFLRVTGATNQLFAYEDSRIKRDFTNSINRVINCDIANEKKAMEAAREQLADIELIEKANLKVTKALEEVIFLRKMYPEASLLELSYASAEHYPEMILKSALNHRFRAIRDLVKSIEAEGSS